MSTSMRSLVVAGLLALLVAQSVAAAGGWYLLLPPVMIKQNMSIDDPALYQPGTGVIGKVRLIQRRNVWLRERSSYERSKHQWR